MNRNLFIKYLSFLALVVLGIGIAVGGSLALDRGLNDLLNRVGYFKAMMPDTTEVYHTTEFSYVATISAQGIRNPIVPIPKSANAVRILAVGDSFTFGWGVTAAQTWATKLETSLSSNGKQVEIINAGMPGADPTNERFICQAYAKRFDVDAIILGMYADDFYQSIARQERRVGIKGWIETNLPTLLRLRHPVIGDYRWSNVKPGDVVDVSSKWRDTIAHALPTFMPLIEKLIPALRSDFLAGKLNVGVITRSINDPNYVTFLLDPGGLSQAINAIDMRLARFKRYCSGNLPVIVLFTPSPGMVSGEYAIHRAELGYDRDSRMINIDIDTPLSDVVRKNGFSFVSTAASFRSDGCPGCYYTYDEHLTPIGTSRVTDILYQPVFRLVQRVEAGRISAGLQLTE